MSIASSKVEDIGFVVQPGDIDDMEAILTRCVDGQVDLGQMGRTARFLSESRFNRTRSVEAFGKLAGGIFRTKRGNQNRARRTRNGESFASREF